MYAIIEDSGSQRKVTQGEEILVDLVEGGEAAAGKTLTFSNVLVLGKGAGDAQVGLPFVKGASVTAEIVEPVVFGEKLYIYHFEPKKAWKKKTGHRQRYTRVKITAING